jgi:hypothetical protein
MSLRSQSKASTTGKSIANSAAPAQSLINEQAPEESSVYLANDSARQSFIFAQEEQQPTNIWIAEHQPTQSYTVSQAITINEAQPVTYIAASVPVAVTPAPSLLKRSPELDRWGDYSPENIDLPFPELPAPDYKCYAPPQVPPGQTRYLKVDEAAQLKNLEQNFNDVRTAIRENNTHLQRNKTQITNINRNHNHLLRIVTNENNFEHNLTNKIVRVADTHRQKIENVKGETRNFKDFKQTQRVEAQGCRRADVQVVQTNSAPALSVAQSAAPAITVAASQPAVTIIQGPVTTSILAPSTTTPVRIIQSGVTLTQASAARSQHSQS